MTDIVLTGSRPTGSPHLGNYFGAYKPAITLGETENRLLFFLADLHALNEGTPAEKLRADSYELTAAMLACGLDPQKSSFYCQSAVPEVAELAWMLSCLAPLGMMQRGVAFKDAQAKGIEINMGVFNYPILMAADILLYSPKFVPVGQDQKQHLEMARDLAGRFNQRYGDDLLRLPEPLIAEEVAVVPGADGAKMSKSKNNVVSIFATDKQWKKQVMAIKTSSEGLDDPKNPDECTVYKLYSLFATPEEQQAMAQRYREGGYGFGHAKLELLEVLKQHLGEAREAFFDWQKRPADLEDVLFQGSQQVREIAKEKLGQLQESVGLLGRGRVWNRG